jgi:hypothetical protein
MYVCMCVCVYVCMHVCMSQVCHGPVKAERIHYILRFLMSYHTALYTHILITAEQSMWLASMCYKCDDMISTLSILDYFLLSSYRIIAS